MLNLEEYFPFPLDDFQLEAIRAINSGNSVVLTAPTGSGKTLIGEFAIYRGLTHDSRVFYTTPLKALSNQKFRDFANQYGENKVGLLTGDISINREAPILVMTTEIFRNMLYGEFDEFDDPLENLESVILDECHYMNDPQRGTVWEETIIHCPTRTQIIALSATIANADQLQTWIEKVHGPTVLINSDKRPVPLDFIFCSVKGLHPLLNNKANGIHPNCKIWRAPKGQKRRGKVGRIMQPKSPSIGFVISKLAERNMLPAIYFIFSRRGCDKAIENIKDLTLVSYSEANMISQKLDVYLKNNQEAIKDKSQCEALKRGIASHHAGLLPAWKELVEELFQQGLIKVVFATETLAAGINMPARTTVISSLSKRTEDGHRLLFSSEFLQMSGRAGRRGKDTQGYVVTLQTRFEGAKEASALAISKPNSLESQFTPSYGMVLNLLQSYTLEKSKELIKRSFGSFLYSGQSSDENIILENLERDLIDLKKITSDVSWKDFDAYEKLKNRLKEERRLLKILEKQAAEKLSEEITNALPYIKDGSLISIKAPQIKRKIVPGLICKKIYESQKIKSLLCLTIDNLFILIKPSYIVSIFNDLDAVDVLGLEAPKMYFSGEVVRGDDMSQCFADRILQISKKNDLQTPQYDLTKEVLAQEQQINNLEETVTDHPAHRFGDPRKLKKYRKRIVDFEQEINMRKKLLEDKENHNWRTFTDLIKILNHFGCLNDLELTEVGQTVGAIRSENELWIGLVLVSGYLDDLDPPELAAIIQAICVDVRRPNLWCNFKPSLKVIDVFNELDSLRKLVASQQNKFHIDIPIYLETELTGIISEWARGKKWKDLVFNTSLDEGDVVRIIRRSIDVLSQVQYCIGVSNKLKSKAKLALKSINRFPVSESNDLIKVSEDINPATKRIDNNS
ncbi:DEAD/DEAH box helicase [Prochlorococcus marinus str. MU1404]|uniref:DEAD/DEAH box helicase n=1 Tax=Prochlorococcus marinus TaxID=1219 RepID=UPI001ADA73C5|nr:DEAD/DEAH box helicase [Prochlorococcus marinus]MBO8230765.1 DEAD/DEAH box helicase [Prochlorococcus marinus XMU1404]MBW3073799.1 DEAD/DEAH box helicase [Prochlorococcus marinus str. MU1404]MCR8544903.1 DEAD/DEAH box helicase [Prochlorococcus marinus CUG1432]